MFRMRRNTSKIATPLNPHDSWWLKLQCSGDSWMYLSQRTPMGNPYISPIYWLFMGNNPQESLENTINTYKYHGYTVRGTPNCPLKCYLPQNAMGLHQWSGSDLVPVLHLKRQSDVVMRLGRVGVFVLSFTEAYSDIQVYLWVILPYFRF